MKNAILILCFIAYFSAIYAQNPRIETFGDRRIETYNYRKGGDSIRFTIHGKNDTIQTALFYRSGKFEKIFWKQDSCYISDKIGRIILKTFSFKNDDFTLDNSVSFYPNGQMLETKSFKNNVRLSDNFAENERLLLSSSVFYTSKGRHYRITDRNGVLITSDRSDTIVYGINPIVRYYDTAYFANGRVYKTEIKEDYAIIAAQYYDENGALTKTLLPDSLQLIIFKDNVDCYYGLKNSQGDTLFKPRFDRIDKIFNLFFVAYVGESASLFKLNGEPITPLTPHLTDVRELNGYNNFATRVDRQENIDIIERQSKIDTTMRYFRFRKVINTVL
jgi:antitoxin component YwqK of YwqJK toxin-antitoxin module